ncbi:MAG: 30S ribosome-binding factor RbfA [Magnetococcales bacterium]|nr:30S ribosome-binding factor RbfA [Magnetococcales bacterium]
MGVRTQKVAGQIQREIAEMLLRGEIHGACAEGIPGEDGVPARREGIISVTGVTVSGDLMVATVYITAYGHGVSQGIQALQRASGYIRGQLGKRMRMRRVPELRFKEDTSLEYGNRIGKLLGSLAIPTAGE